MKKRITKTNSKTTSKKSLSTKVDKTHELIEKDEMVSQEINKNVADEILIVSSDNLENTKILEKSYKLNLTPTPIEEDIKTFENEIGSNNFKNRAKNIRKPLLYGSTVAVVLALLFSVVIISKNPKDNNKLVRTILADVNSVIITPNEEPAIAVVEDPSELAKTDKFYEEAKVGDYVLVYSNRAILFDPKSKKVRLAIPLSKDSSNLK